MGAPALHPAILDGQASWLALDFLIGVSMGWFEEERSPVLSLDPLTGQ